MSNMSGVTQYRITTEEEEILAGSLVSSDSDKMHRILEKERNKIIKAMQKNKRSSSELSLNGEPKIIRSFSQSASYISQDE